MYMYLRLVVLCVHVPQVGSIVCMHIFYRSFFDLLIIICLSKCIHPLNIVFIRTYSYLCYLLILRIHCYQMNMSCIVVSCLKVAQSE